MELIYLSESTQIWVLFRAWISGFEAVLLADLRKHSEVETWVHEVD